LDRRTTCEYELVGADVTGRPAITITVLWPCHATLISSGRWTGAIIYSINNRNAGDKRVQFAVIMDCKVTKVPADLTNTDPRLARTWRIGATAAGHTYA
jgi:hypothetical protein